MSAAVRITVGLTFLIYKNLAGHGYLFTRDVSVLPTTFSHYALGHSVVHVVQFECFACNNSFDREVYLGAYYQLHTERIRTHIFERAYSIVPSVRSVVIVKLHILSYYPQPI